MTDPIMRDLSPAEERIVRKALSDSGRAVQHFDMIVVEALEIAEDVLSRAPFSTQIWPNGMHPNAGIKKIRAALALTRHQSDRGTRDAQQQGE